jgi:Tfp pilus assembly protein PilX
MKTLCKVQEKRMGKCKHRSRGFTLIAALLLLVLLSGIAIGVMFLVNNEGHMSGNEQENNLAYYGAQSGIEKLTADLSALYQTSMAPTNGQIQNLVNSPPDSSMVGSMNYVESINYATDANGNPKTTTSTVSAGSNQGLYAEIIPMTLTVNATRPSGASVEITRKIEVALIPVFQFGVFCGYDCSYFPGPNFSFGGRVHTNGNLFVADGGQLVFNDKMAAFSQIVMDRLENGHLTSAGYTGSVYVSTAAGGCPLNTFPPPTGGGTNCVKLPQSAPAAPGDASWSGSYPGQAGGSANPNFPTISGGTLKGYFVNSLTGATNMQLPFVQRPCTSFAPPCTDPIEIVRKVPGPAEAPTSTLGQSRLYNKAQIRILLADNQADLHPERGPIGDGQDVQFLPNGSVATAGGNEYFGMATAGSHGWVAPLKGTNGTNSGFGSWPLLGEITDNPAAATGAWIRVEYLDIGSGQWKGITTQWLGYGFGKLNNAVLTAPGGNAANPQAILILQQLRPGLTAANATGAGTQGNWFPINFYDAREGEMRDNNPAANATTCAAQGVMNAVELDVGNLKKWLAGAAPYGNTGQAVNYTNQNGYVLYFSDRRGMVGDPNVAAPYTNKTYGESGLEDVVNSGQNLTSNATDGVLEPPSYYGYSPEDVDLNGLADFWGEINLGYGFGTNTSAVTPYTRVPCTEKSSTGATQLNNATTNAVTGARHVLKLVDGSLGNVPVRWDNQLGGFTVASENPVYVQGDYNSSAADPFWTTNGVNNTVAHAAAGIIADSVTILSNNWSDANSLANPIGLAARPSATSYYRMAVAAGKNIPFPQPLWGAQDFGTDGGLHNFLRLLENWGGQRLNYNGSLVSMYYSEYNTGTFKCCTVVYGAPTRNFWFDTLFLNPANLPPGTPTFQDVVNLSYRQNFQPQ